MKHEFFALINRCPHEGAPLCIGPILGAILTVSAATATVASGVALLAVYSLGLGLPFLLAFLIHEGIHS